MVVETVETREQAVLFKNKENSPGTHGYSFCCAAKVPPAVPLLCNKTQSPVTPEILQKIGGEQWRREIVPLPERHPEVKNVSGVRVGSPPSPGVIAT